MNVIGKYSIKDFVGEGLNFNDWMMNWMLQNAIEESMDDWREESGLSKIRQNLLEDFSAMQTQ